MRLAPVISALACAGCLSQAAAPVLQTIMDQAWEFELAEDPLFATSVGDRRYNGRLPSVTQQDEARRAERRREFLERLLTADRAQLSRDEQVNYDMLVRQLQNAIAEYEFQGYLIPITVDQGFHINFARLANQVPLFTTEDYDNYIARLRAFPAYARQHIEIMRTGVERGFTLPRVVLDGYEVTIASHVVSAPERSVFWPPFARFPTTLPETDRERLRNAGRAAIMEAVVPTYREFLDFMTREYIPKARTTIGASELPNGRAYYTHLIKYHTTLDLSADSVHQLGLAEVRRIRAEMDDVIRQTGFRGSFAAFLQFLRTDPRFYARTPEDLLKEAAWIVKRMDGKLPALFATLPRLPYSVQAVPDHLAPKYTGGRYVGPPMGSTEPGYYWVNTYNLRSRPLYVLESLSLHEAVPGHHLQNAIQRELTQLPNFRRFGSVTAFGEGWGLYSERLGLEAGFYTDPYRNFGRLTYEMWRACRLVVDTGLHAMGWTRQQAMDFLASNTALSLHEVRTETDRYIAWPGQALAYKIGELKIRELRGKAEAALRDRFDVRTFHDAILSSGEVPLEVLERRIDGFIQERLSER